MRGICERDLGGEAEAIRGDDMLAIMNASYKTGKSLISLLDAKRKNIKTQEGSSPILPRTNVTSPSQLPKPAEPRREPILGIAPVEARPNR